MLGTPAKCNLFLRIKANALFCKRVTAQWFSAFQTPFQSHSVTEMQAIFSMHVICIACGVVLARNAFSLDFFVSF